MDIGKFGFEGSDIPFILASHLRVSIQAINRFQITIALVKLINPTSGDYANLNFLSQSRSDYCVIHGLGLIRAVEVLIHTDVPSSWHLTLFLLLCGLLL